MERGSGVGRLSTNPTRRRNPTTSQSGARISSSSSQTPPVIRTPDQKIAHAVQDPEESGLAALGRPHEAENLVGLDVQGDLIQGLKIAVKEGQVLDPDFVWGVGGHGSSQQSVKTSAR